MLFWLTSFPPREKKGEGEEGEKEKGEMGDTEENTLHQDSPRKSLALRLPSLRERKKKKEKKKRKKKKKEKKRGN